MSRTCLEWADRHLDEITDLMGEQAAEVVMPLTNATRNGTRKLIQRCLTLADVTELLSGEPLTNEQRAILDQPITAEGKEVLKNMFPHDVLLDHGFRVEVQKPQDSFAALLESDNFKALLEKYPLMIFDNDDAETVAPEKEWNTIYDSTMTTVPHSDSTEDTSAVILHKPEDSNRTAQTGVISLETFSKIMTDRDVKALFIEQFTKMPMDELATFIKITDIKKEEIFGGLFETILPTKNCDPTNPKHVKVNELLGFLSKHIPPDVWEQALRICMEKDLDTDGIYFIDWENTSDRIAVISHKLLHFRFGENPEGAYIESKLI
jgi:hypothetical protein